MAKGYWNRTTWEDEPEVESKPMRPQRVVVDELFEEKGLTLVKRVRRGWTEEYDIVESVFVSYDDWYDTRDRMYEECAYQQHVYALLPQSELREQGEIGECVRCGHSLYRCDVCGVVNEDLSGYTCNRCFEYGCARERTREVSPEQQQRNYNESIKQFVIVS